MFRRESVKFLNEFNFFKTKSNVGHIKIQIFIALNNRATLIAELENLLRHMGDDKSSEFTEIMVIYESITGSRYLNERTVIPKTRALVK